MPDGSHEQTIVPPVLVGIIDCKLGDRVVHEPGRTQVAVDDCRVAGSCVRPSQRMRAHAPIGSQQARVPVLDDRRYLSITQLSNVEVTPDSLPQENIARSLHEPLAQDYAPAVIRIYALARKRFQH